MPTNSTKSRDRKAKQRAETNATANASPGKAATAAPPPPADADAPPPAEGTSLSDRAWWIGSAVVLAVAALLRVLYLELKPLHHDEGVNGFFLLGLLRQGKYQYNPSNYHGPTLYYFTLPLASFADSHHWLGTWALRSVTVAFGLATVWLALCLRRYIGAVGALACAALLAVSPGMVFFSRYYIHEMLFVFFTLGIVVGALRFYEGDAADGGGASEKFGNSAGLLIAVSSFALVAVSLATVRYYASLSRAWTVVFLLLIAACLAALVALLRLYDGARVYYLALAAASAALMFATKETAFITAGVLLIAWGMAALWVRLVGRRGWGRAAEPSRKKARDRRVTDAADAPAPRPLGLVERLGGWTHALFLLVASVAIFLFVNVLYYSSFFTNPKGVKDSVEALMIWRKTGESGFHGYPFYKYFEWLVIGKYAGEWQFGEEAPLAVLASLGALLALWETRRRFPLFAALWGFGLFAAYSIIKYKTPWLALSWLLPFAVSGGYAVDKLYRERGLRVVALGLLAAALAAAAWQSYQLNFVHYDDDHYPYVYAHTKRGFHELLAQMDAIAARTGDKYNAGINVAVENQEYWPMPWYVRDYKHIGYAGKVTETTDAVIIVKVSQVPEVESLLGSRYQRVGGVYQLRPGVDLALFGRRDLLR
ncbi:MAG TPA: hypothetical protein VM864_02785 [Pyrinomonadaceae bacterium]|nr:hypothetical protein [Pyrinomonadaceae bacterium]